MPAVAEERHRIARELHDVVGHNVSLMVTAAQALGTDAEGEARRLADSIACLGREAMAELATTLDQLRPVEEPEGERRPSLARLPGLVERARAAGIGAELRIEGPLRPVAEIVDLAGYRIVQEALTNVVRHSDALRATVSLRYEPDMIALEIVDDGSGADLDLYTPIPGRGLTGMRERAALTGGSLSYGRREGGGFRVAALLPAGR